MAGNFVERSRHGTVFYFRRRVPRDLLEVIGRRHIYVTLRTQDRRTALLRARVLAVHSDRVFEEIRLMPRDKTPKFVDTFYGIHIDFHELSGKPKNVTFTDVKPEDTEAIAALAEKFAPGIAGTPGKPTPTIREAIDDLVKSGEVGQRSLKEYMRTLEAFASHFGEGVQLGTISQERFAEWAEGIKANPKWSEKTKNGIITTVARLFNRYEGRSSAVSSMSTKGLKFRRTRPAGQDRDAFTVAEVKELFTNAARYRDTEPCKWWITVAPAFLGCRIEELAQAHLSADFYRDAATGAMVLNITEDKVDASAPPKSVKTLAGWRRVPIHPALEHAGFVRFIEQQRAAGYATLFAAQWTPWLDRKTGATIHSHSAVKWGGRELEKLKKAGVIADRKLTYFHSLRHSFNTMLASAGIGEEWRAGLMGQSFGAINSQVYNKAKEDVSQTLPLILKALEPLVLILNDVLDRSR
jgi:integrase